MQFRIIFKQNFEDQLFSDMEYYELIDFCRKNDIEPYTIEEFNRYEIEEYLIDRIVLKDHIFDIKLGEINDFILDNKDKLTNIEVEEEEYGYYYLKCMLDISEEEFVKLLENEDIIQVDKNEGMLSDLGLTTSFIIEFPMTTVVVSVLYDDNYPDEVMEEYENSLISMIDSIIIRCKDMYELYNKILDGNQISE